MKEEDYPALYQAANEASLGAQTDFLNCVKGYAVLSVAGAGLAFYGIESTILAVLAAIFFFGGLCLSGLIAVKKFEITWYRTRAVAESIKTISWRFIMHGKPFDDQSLVKVKVEFRNVLRKILKEHRDLAPSLAGVHAEKEQITAHMLQVRELPLEERIKIYREQRIDEQRAWYAKKSKYNKAQGNTWFLGLIGLQVGAILFTILRVGYPQWEFLPTEIFIVAATNVLAWTQVKRFRELAAAYGLAAHEIGLAKEGLEDFKSEEKFSKFVSDTENAFSREHTQWVARRDM